MLEDDPAAFVEMVLKIVEGANNEINGRNLDKTRTALPYLRR